MNRRVAYVIRDAERRVDRMRHERQRPNETTTNGANVTKTSFWKKDQPKAHFELPTYESESRSEKVQLTSKTTKPKMPKTWATRSKIFGKRT